MSQSTQQSDRQPRTSLRNAYENCVHARRQWMSVRGRTTDDGVREEAHGDLHEAVMSWFEILQPYIANRSGEVKQLWENAPLWPARPATKSVLACENDHAFDPSADDAIVVEPGDACTACGNPVEHVTVHRRDSDGRELYEWACGLKRLADWTGRTVEIEIEGNEWEVGSETVERIQRLNPEVLLRAARHLDDAAEKCGLLEETEKELPVGEVVSE